MAHAFPAGVEQLQPPAFGADPDVTGAIFGQGGRAFAARAVDTDPHHPPVGGIDAADTAAKGPRPDPAVAGLEQRHDAVRADGTRIAGLAAEPLHTALARHAHEALGHRADPQAIRAIDQQAHDSRVAQYVGVAQDLFQCLPTVAARIEASQPCAHRAHPEPAG